MRSPHYFLGIDIPEVLENRLSEQQNKLKESLDYKMWTNQNDFHITLKFLGSVEEEQLAALVDAFKKASDKEPFNCMLEGLSFFGKQDGPRVLMQKVQKTAYLTAVQKAFEQAADTCGFPPEKRTYTPHVTLAKKFTSACRPMNEVMHHAELELDGFTCNEVVLFRIEPDQNPRYVPVIKFALKGGGKGGATH